MKINIIPKFVLLMVTGLPGLFKLLSLFYIKYKYGNEVLGIYTNDIYVVLTLSLFTGIGWSALLLKLIPVKKFYRSIQVLFSLVIYSIMTVLITLPILYLLQYYNYIFNVIGVFFLVLSTSLYYLIRHYLLAKREYNHLLIMELLIIVSFFLFLWLWGDKDNLLYITSLSFIMPIVYIALLFFKLSESLYGLKIVVSKNNIYQGFLFSFNNLISGGVISILPIVFMQFGGVIYAGYMGILLNITNAMMLISKAIANFKIVSLQYAIKKKKEKNELYIYRKYMFISNILGFILSIIASYILIQYDLTYIGLIHIYSVTLFLLMSLFISSQNIVESNYLFLKDMQHYGIMANVFYAGSFIAIYFLQNMLRIYNLNILIFGLFILSNFRFLYLSKIVNKKSLQNV